MKCRGWMMAGVAALTAMVASVTHADVFNMTGGQTSLQFVTVGDPGNAGEQSRLSNGDSTYYGSVPYTYQMGKYDVTVGQYCQFLNAVAKTDTYRLYSSYMATNYPTWPVAITQSGSPGSYAYTVTGSDPQAANCPVSCVSWGDAARFCNWLQNGQPTGAEGTSTTETGAYTLNGATTNSALMAINRNPGATYFIPSENEWYKAAYYNASNASYWLYPTQSNTAPSNVLSATGTNNANFALSYGNGFTDPTNLLTPVGAFAGSPGPYGTYDMGGDVFQWNEADWDGTQRGFRGCGWYYSSDLMASANRDPDYPTDDTYSNLGFRVASVPEPGGIILLVSGAIAGLIWWRRR